MEIRLQIVIRLLIIIRDRIVIRHFRQLRIWKRRSYLTEKRMALMGSVLQKFSALFTRFISKITCMIVVQFFKSVFRSTIISWELY